MLARHPLPHHGRNLQAGGQGGAGAAANLLDPPLERLEPVPHLGRCGTDELTDEPRALPLEGVRILPREACPFLEIEVRLLRHDHPRPGSPRLSHMTSTRRLTSASIAMGRPHARLVSPGHFWVASIPILDPRPDTGEAKSR